MKRLFNGKEFDCSQMVIDFGKVGVAVEMCILGFILGIGFKIIQKTKDYFKKCIR